MQRHVVSVLTDASGDVTAYTSAAVEGEVLSIRYIPDGTSPLDTGADVTVTGRDSTTPIITITNLGTSAVSMAPRQATVSVANAAALYAAGGAAVNDRIGISGEQIKIVVAQGGNAKLGKFHITVG
ncbi:MAG: hypothetical protein ABL993_05230 [Vicinamibacterales bacterium]